MLTVKEYSRIIELALAELRYPSRPANLFNPISYALGSGGKRLRPVMTLAVADALCGDPHRAINQAMAVEMFHNFTLLHDDVMDHADMRRGRPTVHKKWDERTAILSGDAMLSLAYELAAKCDDHLLRQVIGELGTTAMDVYKGQQFDMDYESLDNVSQEQYEEMIHLKTAALLGFACALGAIMGGADDYVRRQFYLYGHALGMAFQYQDDWLDTFGSAKVFGKEPGGDILNDKKTWLRILALERDDSGVIEQETVNPSAPAVKIARVQEVYLNLGIEAVGREKIDGFFTEALRALDNCRLSPDARDFFVTLANKIVIRDH